jgi:predicted nucleic acid-binding protein
VKAVFDTNILIAAFLTEGLCSGLLIRARKRDFDLVLSDDIIREFKNTLTKKFKISSADVSEITSIVTEAASEISGAPSGRSRRLPVITRPPASYGAFLPRLEPGDSKSRGIDETTSIARTCRDQDDDMIIACAVSATADYIVTGDEDLLVLKRYKNIVIINPRNFEALFV